MTGWVKLHRQSLSNGWLRNHRLWAFWCYCLLKASHKDIEVTVGYQRVFLKAGQFVFGRKQAAKELSLTERQIRTCQFALITSENLSVKTTNKFSVITVVNWHLYQDAEKNTVSQNVQEPTSNRPATDHKQECKELKKESSIPNFDEVKAYCLERNKGVDPQRWFDFYESKGWLIGKNRMKNWKAAVRTWEKSIPSTQGQDLGYLR